MTLMPSVSSIRQNPIVRLVLLFLGIFFLVLTLIIGPLPGPGGIVTFAIGLGLILQNSRWARRRYVMFKRDQPKIGGWTDWGLRRASAKRRLLRDKQRAIDEGQTVPNQSPLQLRDWWRWMRAHQDDGSSQGGG